MAGNKQHPTDDVEGHGRYWQDPEAVDDRGVRVPDDTEGHIVRFKQDPEAIDDTQGHLFKVKGQDTEATDEDQVGDDTQGHFARAKQDTEAVDEDQAGDDTQGHGVRRY